MAKRSRDKGSRGEREVAAIWRSYGFEKAAPSPGSGSLRPWGAGDVSPWPGDLVFVRPWLVEVKYDEKVYAPSRGWVGSSFVRKVCAELSKLYYRHLTIGGERPMPVLFARANLQPWRVFIPEWVFVQAYGITRDPLPGVYVELTVDQFFDEVVFGQQLKLEYRDREAG